jgi:hypothetical protein
MPELSLAAQAVLSIGYAVLLLAFLAMALPHARRFFLSERWGGYAQSAPDVDAIQNPVVTGLVMVSWVASAVCLALGWWVVAASFVNLLFCRYFFVHMRWKGVARGMGAPGFMTYWLAAAVFLLELALRFAPDARPLVVLALQVDLAFIMLSAGFYKLSAGYARNHGMELGMANPEWGYWWRWWARMPPGHWVFRLLNHLAWSTEVVAAVLMVIPATRLVGAALIMVSFVFIATQIRLGVLCEMVILCGVLFFSPDGRAEPVLAWLGVATRPAGAAGSWPVVDAALRVGLWTYLVLLPLAHGGLFYNFYLRRSLPSPLQRILDLYTNLFGIIIWRVFSVDVVNFFVRIYRQPSAGGPRTLVSRYGWGGSLRYAHVCESIAVTSLFTTLKYYPSNDALFLDRLLRYARTVPCPSDAVLVFEYVSIWKGQGRFDFLPVAEYAVDVCAGTVRERILSQAVSVRSPHPVSPVHEGTRPGSYAPLVG